MDLKEIPQGSVVAVYGRPGVGKTYICLDMVGHIHTADDEAIGVWFDTEYRMNISAVSDFGVDEKRFLMLSAANTRSIIEGFDQIGDAVVAGAPIKVIVIDTVNAIQRPLDPDQPLGAMTMMLAALMKCARAHGITLVLVSHVRQSLSGFNIVPGYKPALPGLDTFVDYMVEVYSPTGVNIEKVERKDDANV